MTELKGNMYRVGGEIISSEDPWNSDNIEHQKKNIEPWLATIFQSEHLSLLLGSGFTMAVAKQAGQKAPNMAGHFDGFPYEKELRASAIKTAKDTKRGTPNIEDQINAANTVMHGLKILGHKSYPKMKSALDSLLKKFLTDISNSENELRSAIEKCNPSDPSEGRKDAVAEAEKQDLKLDPLVMLVSFLLSFSCRTASRERLHIFTTNYDRLIEYGADIAGLHVLDRFVGHLEPVFRSSRLDIDMHYNPPGIRGEPRYLEGVVRLTKLHGSLDWVYRNGYVRKIGLPFGPCENHFAIHGLSITPDKIEADDDADNKGVATSVPACTMVPSKDAAAIGMAGETTGDVPIAPDTPTSKAATGDVDADKAHAGDSSRCGSDGTVMIYPNSAKDRETSEYPYVELFRDYAAAVCRPNSVLVTYGYGFGDDHINRTIEDMLTIPSTHLVIIAYNDENNRISNFCKKVGRVAQISLLFGQHFGNMATLVNNYLPRPTIDSVILKKNELLRSLGRDVCPKNE